MTGPAATVGPKAHGPPGEPGTHLIDWPTDVDRLRIGGEGPNYPSDVVSVELTTPHGTRLSVGRHDIHKSASLPDEPPAVGLDLRVGSTSCSEYAGTMDVLALTRGPDGLLTSLAFEYETTCEGQPPLVRGSVRWASPLPYAHTETTGVDAGATPEGRTARGEVVVTNAGTTTQTYGASTYEVLVYGMQGVEQRGRVVLEADGCTGVTLAPGGSCRVAVAMPSDGRTSVQGLVVTPDGTARGAAYSPVRMYAIARVPDVVLTATPERGSVTLTSSRQNDSYRVLRTEDGGPEQTVETAVPLPWSDTDVVQGSRYTYRVVPRAYGLDGDPSDAVTLSPLPLVDGEAGTFVPVDPVRLVDTRSGLGGRTGPLGPNAVMTVDPGQEVPDGGVSAVLLNVTGTEPTSPTFLSVAPVIGGTPGTSNVNLSPGQTRPTQVVVPVAADGTFQVYNRHGSTHVVVDLQGFYSLADGVPGGEYHPAPYFVRELDTRSGDRVPLGPGEEIWVPMQSMGRGAYSAVALNLTVTEPTSSGYVTAWPGDGPAPTVSNANFVAGQTVANHAVVPLTFDEEGTPGIALRNSLGHTHVLVDVLGWYDDGTTSDGLRFAPAPPTRVLDTRSTGGRLARDEVRLVPGALLPPAKAHVINLTATEAVGAGWARAWSGQGWTGTSTVNVQPGENSPNLTTTGIDASGSFSLTAHPSALHLVVDHLGYFY